MPIPRSEAHECGARHRGRCAPEGDPVPHGPLVDQRDARPIRPPVPRLDEAIAESFVRSFHEATERRARVVVKADFSGG